MDHGGGRLADMGSSEKKEALAILNDEETIRTGFLMKTGARKNWQSRLFVLKRRHLAYFKTNETEQPLGVLNLKYCTIGNSSEREFCFAVNKPGRTYWLSASSDEEKILWMSDISDCIASLLLEKGGSGGASSSPLVSSPSSPTLSSSPSSPPQKERIKSVLLGDVITKQGSLTKKGQNRQNWKTRWFILSQNCLSYCRSQQDLRPLGQIMLDSKCRVVPEPGKPFSFQLITPGRTYFIQSKSNQEKDEWMKVISDTISNFS